MMNIAPPNTLQEWKPVLKDILESCKYLTAKGTLKRQCSDFEAAVNQGHLPNVSKCAGYILDTVRRNKLTVSEYTKEWLSSMETIEKRGAEGGDSRVTRQHPQQDTTAPVQKSPTLPKSSQQSTNTNAGSTIIPVSYQGKQPMQQGSQPFDGSKTLPGKPGTSAQANRDSNEKYAKDIIDMDKKNKELEAANAAKDSEIAKLKAENAAYENDSKTLNERETTYKSRVDSLNEKVNQLNRQLLDKDKDLEKKKKQMQDEYIKAIEEKENGFTTEYNKLGQAYQEEKKKCKYLAAEMTKEIRDRDEEINKLKAEKSDLSSRYSQLASERLKQDNPDIVDLSDPNRAMKLADRYNGIYNDNWTDASEELHSLKMSNKSAIEFLLNGLLESFIFCENVAKCQLANLNQVLLRPLQSTSQKVNQAPRITSATKKALMEARRQMAAVNSEAIMQEFVSNMLKEANNEEERKRVAACKTYYQKCAELSWLMVLHDPPLFMKADIRKGDKVDPNLCTVLSKGDKIDYLVWPPLLNGQQGGVLAKGVVEVVQVMTKQGKK